MVLPNPEKKKKIAGEKKKIYIGPPNRKRRRLVSLHFKLWFCPCFLKFTLSILTNEFFIFTCLIHSINYIFINILNIIIFYFFIRIVFFLNILFFNFWEKIDVEREIVRKFWKKEIYKRNSRKFFWEKIK
jgi:hypothetical protein